MPELKLAETVGEAADGSQRAWDQLVDQFSSMVWRIARSHSLNLADASDVSQTVWLRLAEHIGRLREPEKVGAWLAVTTKHEAQRLLRRRQFQIPVSHERLVHIPEPTGSLSDNVIQQEEASALWRAFGMLGDPCRALLAMLISDPTPSYTVISDTLGLPIGTIGPKRSRCLGYLRKLLKTNDGETFAVMDATA